MNDYAEQLWFLGRARKRLDELQQGADQIFISPLIEHFDEMGSTPYICCFSREGDVLSQWRTYSDDGAGFAVGFSSQWLKRKGEENLFPGGSRLWEVIYDADAQAEGLNHYIQDYLGRVKVDGRPADPGRHTLLAIWTLAAICKNPGFREEKEFRLVGVVPHYPADQDEGSPHGANVLEMRFRPTGARITPYFVLPFPESAIREIRLGPKNYARKDNAPLKAFLDANGYDSDRIEIVPSEATYGYAF